MAHTTTHNDAPLGAVTILRIGNVIMSAKDAVGTWYEVRKTRKMLLNLSDDRLADIGLKRFDLL